MLPASVRYAHTEETMRLQKPQLTFSVTVRPVFRVVSCDAKLAEEKRGLHGWHQFTKCPKCQLLPNGWEVWGENGHMQAHLVTREHLLHWVKIKARERWISQHPMTRGQMWGYKFRTGEPMYYRAN